MSGILNYMSISELFGEDKESLDKFSEIAAWSFGDSDYTLVNKMCFLGFLRDNKEFFSCLIGTVIERVMSLPKDTYIDLEN